MTAGYVVGYDAIRTNVPLLPKGAQQYAGYSTGSGVVPWTEEDFQQHATALGPCLRIDQDPAASDATADYLDVEAGAATVADVSWWAKKALADYRAGTRPGQRSPAIYCSASNVTPVVNALIAGGVASGVGLIIADWSLSEPQAVTDVLAAAGPFPVVGVQWSDPGPFDVDIYSRAWLEAQSGKPAPPHPHPAPPPVPVPQPVPAPVEDEMPSGVISTPSGARETHSWLGGTVSQIVLASDWEGLQASPPVVAVRLIHGNAAVTEVGDVTVNLTAVVNIADPAGCNGCSFDRVDAGPATVGWHCNPVVV